MINESVSLGALRGAIMDVVLSADADALAEPHRDALQALAERAPVDLVVGYMRACWAAHEAAAGVTDAMLERLVEACAIVMRFQFHGAGALASLIRDAVRADLNIETPRPPAGDPPNA